MQAYANPATGSPSHLRLLNDQLAAAQSGTREVGTSVRMIELHYAGVIANWNGERVPAERAINDAREISGREPAGAHPGFAAGLPAGVAGRSGSPFQIRFRQLRQSSVFQKSPSCAGNTGFSGPGSPEARSHSLRYDVNEFVRTYARPNARRGTEGRYQAVFSDNGATKALAEAQPIVPPVLIVDGTSYPFTENTFRQLAGNEVTAVHIQDVGHLVAQEAPEQLAAEILKFTKGIDAGHLKS